MNVQLPTDDEICAAFEKGQSAILDLFHDVSRQVQELAQQLAKQGEILQELQARLAKNSDNSSKPPSSDGYGKVKRTESLRKPGDKPNGGQPGHEGQTLMASEHPDRVESHEVPSCAHCQASLAAIEAVGYEERQVFDIPAIRIEVTAHRAEIKVCPACGSASKGTFPEAVTQAVQYGPMVNTWASYFPNQHHIPVERTTEIFEDLVQHRVSEATVLKASEQLDRCIEPSTAAVKGMLSLFMESLAAHAGHLVTPPGDPANDGKLYVFVYLDLARYLSIDHVRSQIVDHLELKLIFKGYK